MNLFVCLFKIKWDDRAFLDSSARSSGFLLIITYTTTTCVKLFRRNVDRNTCFEIHQRPELVMAVRLDGNIKKNSEIRAKSHLDFWMKFHGNDKWRDRVNRERGWVISTHVLPWLLQRLVKTSRRRRRVATRCTQSKRIVNYFEKE